MKKRTKLIIFLLLIGFIFSAIIYLNLSKENLLVIQANPDKGFNYSYFLYLPEDIKKGEAKYLLIEPNNTGTVSDDINLHKKEAKELASYGTGRYIADKLNIPLLIPSFSRPESDITMYTHALDSDTLKNREGKLKRIDLQLIAMIEDAKNRLNNREINLQDKILLYGFSASGNFTNRFTALYPKMVKATVSGGVNCMPILPVEYLNKTKLIYHIGVAELKKLIGKEFDLDSYQKVPQYIFMGELDDNDTLPFDDAFNDEERKIVKNVLGIEMKKRWEIAKDVYKQNDINADLVMYRGIGHTVNEEIRDDILDFFKNNI